MKCKRKQTIYSCNNHKRCELADGWQVPAPVHSHCRLFDWPQLTQPWHCSCVSQRPLVCQHSPTKWHQYGSSWGFQVPDCRHHHLRANFWQLPPLQSITGKGRTESSRADSCCRVPRYHQQFPCQGCSPPTESPELTTYLLNYYLLGSELKNHLTASI